MINIKSDRGRELLKARPSDDHVFPAAWYAVAWSRDLKKEPLKRRLVGQDIVLFRDSSGRPKAVTAYCAHRGADLSLGKCSGGNIRCAYHGWEFDGTGECRRIPAHPDRPIPEFAKLVGYPVQERAGLVWVYASPHGMGGTKTPELDLFAEVTDDAFVLSPYDETWKAHLTRVVESVLDVAHLAFVHKKTIGKRVPEEVQSLRFDVPDADSIVIENGGGLLEYKYPQQWILKPTRPGKNRFINFVTFTPIDSEHTQIFGYAGRTFLRSVPGMNGMFSSYSRRILREDQALVESQHPRPIPEALRMEAHVPADAPQVRFRQRWFEFLTGEEDRIIVPD